MRKICTFLLITSILISCGKGGKQQNLIKETEKIAQGIDSDIKRIWEINLENGNFVKELFENQSKYDLNIDNMDVEDGGKYKLFEDTIYYKPEDDGGCSIYVSGLIPVNDEIKKVVKLLENATPVLKDTVEKNDGLILSAWIFGPQHFAYNYPYMDVISNLPPKLDVPTLPFYAAVDKPNNPELKPIWTPVAEPFVGMSGEGWIITTGFPVAINNEVVAISEQVCQISYIIKKHVVDSEHLIMLVSKNKNLLGSSKNAKNLLDLKEIEEINYVEQMKTNSFIADEFKLDYEKNKTGLKEIASKIETENDFEVTIDDKNYFVHVNEIGADTGMQFYVIGLLGL